MQKLSDFILNESLNTPVEYYATDDTEIPNKFTFLANIKGTDYHYTLIRSKVQGVYILEYGYLTSGGSIKRWQVKQSSHMLSVLSTLIRIVETTVSILNKKISAVSVKLQGNIDPMKYQRFMKLIVNKSLLKSTWKSFPVNVNYDKKINTASYIFFGRKTADPSKLFPPAKYKGYEFVDELPKTKNDAIPSEVLGELKPKVYTRQPIKPSKKPSTLKIFDLGVDVQLSVDDEKLDMLNNVKEDIPKEKETYNKEKYEQDVQKWKAKYNANSYEEAIAKTDEMQKSFKDDVKTFVSNKHEFNDVQNKIKDVSTKLSALDDGSTNKIEVPVNNLNEFLFMLKDRIQYYDNKNSFYKFWINLKKRIDEGNLTKKYIKKLASKIFYLSYYEMRWSSMRQYAIDNGFIKSNKGYNDWFIYNSFLKILPLLYQDNQLQKPNALPEDGDKAVEKESLQKQKDELTAKQADLYAAQEDLKLKWGWNSWDEKLKSPTVDDFPKTTDSIYALDDAKIKKADLPFKLQVGSGLYEDEDFAPVMGANFGLEWDDGGVNKKLEKNIKAQFHTKEKMGNVKEEYVEAMKDYTNGSYTSMNGYFHKIKDALLNESGDNDPLAKLKMHDNEMWKECMKAVKVFNDDMVTPEAMWVFRKTKKHGTWSDLEIGKKVITPGILSTSIDPDVWSGSIKLALYIPKGTPFWPTLQSSYSSHPGEKEIVFPPLSVFVPIEIQTKTEYDPVYVKAVYIGSAFKQLENIMNNTLGNAPMDIPVNVIKSKEELKSTSDDKLSFDELYMKYDDGTHTSVENGGKTKVWKNSNGLFHRENGPALMREDSYLKWRINGEIHRTDGPAIIYAPNTYEYYLNDIYYSSKADWEKAKNDINTDTSSVSNTKNLVKSNMSFDELVSKYDDGTHNDVGSFSNSHNWKDENGDYHRDNGPAYISNKLIAFFRHGNYHREDGPAIMRQDGKNQYYLNDEMYFEDEYWKEIAKLKSTKSVTPKPTVDNSKIDEHLSREQLIQKYDDDTYTNKLKSGTRIWKDEDGQYHRDNGPAIIRVNGSINFWKHGEIHRDNGPAIMNYDDTKEWYQNGVPHRIDGPAVVYPSGDTEYWVDGKKLSEEEFKSKYSSDGINPEKEKYAKVLLDDGPYKVNQYLSKKEYDDLQSQYPWVRVQVLENAKYEMTYDKQSGYFQIKALKNITMSKQAGDLGGLIEKEANLSQEGTCWIYENALVRQFAKVTDDSLVGANKSNPYNPSMIVEGFVAVTGSSVLINESIDKMMTIDGDRIFNNENYTYSDYEKENS